MLSTRGWQEVTKGISRQAFVQDYAVVCMCLLRLSTPTGCAPESQDKRWPVVECTQNCATGHGEQFNVNKTQIPKQTQRDGFVRTARVEALRVLPCQSDDVPHTWCQHIRWLESKPIGATVNIWCHWVATQHLRGCLSVSFHSFLESTQKADKEKLQELQIKVGKKHSP